MKNPRPLIRVVHLIASAWLGVFVYSPWASNPTFLWATRFVLLPLVALTGIAMWQQVAFNRVVRRLEVLRARA
jgi:hypothetical protein